MNLRPLTLVAAVTLSAVPVVLAQTTQPTTLRAPATLEAFHASVADASPGHRVLTPVPDLEKIPAIPLTLTTSPDAPQYLLSDKPEYFRTGDGIAMQEVVTPGIVRLYVYHVPEPTGAKKTIPAVIENLSDQPLTLTMLRQGVPAPGGDYHRMAKQALVDFMSPPKDLPAPVVIPPKGRAVIDPKLSSIPVTKDILVHGLYEFSIDQPARITTFQKDPDAPIDVMDKLPKLPQVLPGFHASGAGRGLFTRSNVDGTFAGDAVYDTADGVRQVVVANGTTDPWLEGRDSLDPSGKSINKGNYGVMYTLKLRLRSSDGKRLAVLLSTDRTGRWCETAGAVVKVAVGGGPETVLPLPIDTPRFNRLPEAALITLLTPGKDTPTEITLTYTPPGASCLPTPILLIPVP